MNYFLDTNIIIYALKNSYSKIKDHFLQVPSTSIVIPSIVLAEIEYGARKCKDYQKTIQKYQAFTGNFISVSFDDKAIKEYGLIRSSLEKKGEVIGANDLMIAAIVKASNGILITHNTKEFSKIEGLRIEDWCE